MADFVAYHSDHVMGAPLRPLGARAEFVSRKRSVLNRAIGQRVWIITGTPRGKRTEYRLLGCYSPDTVEGRDGTFIVAGPVTGSPISPIDLSGLPWFRDLLRAMANFSIGFSELTNARYIRELEALLGIEERAEWRDGVSAEGDATVRRLETSALVVGYGLSRLDRNLLSALGWTTWNHAYDVVGRALNTAPLSIKNLRDEFDPIHDNARRGWADREMLPSRMRVVDELCDVSDAALTELVREILSGRTEAVADAIDALSAPSGLPSAAANRLLTGRTAERFFLENCEQILGVSRESVVDRREALCGFDFEVAHDAIEVKGLRELTGEVLFTDLEWQQAMQRRSRYVLIVVGRVLEAPLPRVIRDPSVVLQPKCAYRSTVRAEWRARLDVRQS